MAMLTIDQTFLETKLTEQMAQTKLKKKPPLKKKHLDFCSCFSLEPLILVPNRVTNRTDNLTHSVAINCFKRRVRQFSVIELGVSEHDLIYFTINK